MFFHWNLHSPSFIRETNPEQLERNGDQTIFSYFFVFLDNNIKPTQTFGNNIRPLPITTATPWLSLHSVLTVKNLPRLHRKNGLYALLIVSPSLILTNAMTARIRDSQVISNSLDQTAYSHLSSSTSSFPLSRFLWKIGIWLIKQNQRVRLLICTYLEFMLLDVWRLIYQSTYLAWDNLTQ